MGTLYTFVRSLIRQICHHNYSYLFIYDLYNLWLQFVTIQRKKYELTYFYEIPKVSEPPISFKYFISAML